MELIENTPLYFRMDVERWISIGRSLQSAQQELMGRGVSETEAKEVVAESATKVAHGERLRLYYGTLLSNSASLMAFLLLVGWGFLNLKLAHPRFTLTICVLCGICSLIFKFQAKKWKSVLEESESLWPTPRYTQCERPPMLPRSLKVVL